MGRRWAVLVTAHDVRGCTGTFRWRWRARLEAHSKLRYWPGPKVVEIAQIDGERIVDGDEVYPGGEDPEWHKIKLAIRLVRQLRRLSGRRHDSIVKRRDSDMTQDAESVRGHCPPDGTFPPPMIARWVRWRTVSLTALVDELRFWADYYEVMQEQERHHA